MSVNSNQENPSAISQSSPNSITVPLRYRNAYKEALVPKQVIIN